MKPVFISANMMHNAMKAVFVRERDSVSVDEVEQPKMVSEGDVVVRMRACGLCGSDLEKVYGEYGMTSARLGHEPAGEVVAVGSKVANFKPGDRVFIHHHVACYTCHYCLHGDYTMCPAYQTSNISPCGLAEEFLVPEWNVSRGGLVKLEDKISFDEASLVEPFACCIRAMNKCDFKKGDDVAVFGAGPAGLMNAMLARTFGAGRVFVIDINDFRLDFARGMGIEAFNAITDPEIAKKIISQTGGRGVDLCIVATGSTKAILQSQELTRRGGKIMLFGVPSKGSQVSVDMNKLYSNEHSLIPSYAASEVETNEALKLISAGRIDLSSLITHRFDIARASEAVKCAHEAKDAMKVIVTASDK